MIKYKKLKGVILTYILFPNLWIHKSIFCILLVLDY